MFVWVRGAVLILSFCTCSYLMYKNFEEGDVLMDVEFFQYQFQLLRGVQGMC